MANVNDPTYYSQCPEHGDQEVTNAITVFPHMLLKLACGHWVTEAGAANVIIPDPLKG
jgi:hypothetical protein